MNDQLTKRGNGFADLTGCKFGRLLVVSEGEQINGRIRWMCRCDCGKTKSVVTASLRSGNTKSCGCLAVQLASLRNSTHKMRHTPEYKSWSEMFQRCENPSNKAYARYGGRGISVCREWLSFEVFLRDMGKKPSPAHSLDRFPDNNGNYEPGNCRWATDREQCYNRRSNRLITARGRTLPITRWAEEVGTYSSLINNRIKAGWTPESAIFKPARKITCKSQNNKS